MNTKIGKDALPAHSLGIRTVTCARCPERRVSITDGRCRRLNASVRLDFKRQCNIPEMWVCRASGGIESLAQFSETNFAL
jgi:hypothetical protein